MPPRYLTRIRLLAGARRQIGRLEASEREALAEIEPAHIRIADDFRRMPMRQHLAGMDDIGAIDQAERFAHIVVGDEHADAAGGEMANQLLMSATAIGSMPANGSSSSM